MLHIRTVKRLSHYVYSTGAAKIIPDEPEPFVILGVICAIMGEYEDAIVHMQRALQNNPTDYTVWNKLGAVEALYYTRCGTIEVCVYAWQCRRTSALSTRAPVAPDQHCI